MIFTQEVVEEFLNDGIKLLKAANKLASDYYYDLAIIAIENHITQKLQN